MGQPSEQWICGEPSELPLPYTGRGGIHPSVARCVSGHDLKGCLPEEMREPSSTLSLFVVTGSL
eukprot:16066558-Heterocapsa_arctica.AAC.1